MSETLLANQARRESPRSKALFNHGSREHATLHCCALKKHLEDLIHCEYLDEFILDLEEDSVVREILVQSVD